MVRSSAATSTMFSEHFATADQTSSRTSCSGATADTVEASSDSRAFSRNQTRCGLLIADGARPRPRGRSATSRGHAGPPRTGTTQCRCPSKASSAACVDDCAARRRHRHTRRRRRALWRAAPFRRPRTWGREPGGPCPRSDACAISGSMRLRPATSRAGTTAAAGLQSPSSSHAVLLPGIRGRRGTLLSRACERRPRLLVGGACLPGRWIRVPGTTAAPPRARVGSTSPR